MANWKVVTLLRFDSTQIRPPRRSTQRDAVLDHILGTLNDL
jgi:hypothetical protein